MVLSLYSRRMTIRDIEAHLRWGAVREPDAVQSSPTRHVVTRFSTVSRLIT
jgi:hypothetical protein